MAGCRIRWRARVGLLLLALALAGSLRAQDEVEENSAGTPCGESGVDRRDPAAWLLWRHGPMPFPTWVSSPVPELLKDGPVIDFGKFGRDLVIVEPNQISATRDGAALKGMLGLIAKKVPNALTLPAEKVDAAQRSHQLLVVGTLQGNPVAREVLGAQADTFLQGIPPGRVSPQGRGQSLCPRA